MILLWGPPADPPLARVAEELDRLGTPFQILDQRDALRTTAELTYDHRLHTRLWTSAGLLQLDAVTAAYHRCQDSRHLPAVVAAGPASHEWQHVLALEDLLLSWLEITSALVINRPSHMAANSSKPYQLAHIASFGWRVPETLVTTDPMAVEAFWVRHGEVIYKSVSGVRSQVARLRPSDRERLPDIAFCPTQLQEYVPGIDYRVHVVRDRVFPTRIESALDDYRFPQQGDRPRLYPCEIPGFIAQRCVQMTSEMGLPVAGIDLRQTPHGDWFCFEVNPSPAFSYYEDTTGQPIARCIAEVLTHR